MMRYYYARTDENGVLCVEHLHEEKSEDENTWTQEQVAAFASNFPDTVYFSYWSGDQR